MSADLLAIAPLIVTVLVAAGVLIVDLVIPGRRTAILITALAGLAAIAAATVAVGQYGLDQAGAEVTAFGGAYTVDSLTTFLDLLFISIVALTIVFAPDYLEPRGLPIAMRVSVCTCTA